MTFRALMVDKDAGGQIATSIEEVDDARLPDGDGTVAVEYSTLNYKDGLCISGAGGLVRAYGGTAAECLRRAPRQELIAQRIFEFELGFEWLGAIYAAIEQCSANKLDESFDSNGARLRVQVAIDRADALCTMLRDATRGAIMVRALD